MREIKFRAWDSADKVMRELYSIVLPNTTNGEFRRNIYMQYTGLKDKNGKEIYEGDVIRRQNENIGKCIFSLGSFWYEGKDGRWGFCMNDAYTGGFEVIGNVYETPDLITTNEQ